MCLPQNFVFQRSKCSTEIVIKITWLDYNLKTFRNMIVETLPWFHCEILDNM